MILSIVVTFVAFVLLIAQFFLKKGDARHVIRYVVILICVAIALASIERGLPDSFSLSTHFLVGYTCIAALIAVGITGVLLYRKIIHTRIHSFAAVLVLLLFVLTFVAPFMFNP